MSWSIVVLTRTDGVWDDLKRCKFVRCPKHWMKGCIGIGVGIGVSTLLLLLVSNVRTLHRKDSSRIWKKVTDLIFIFVLGHTRSYTPLPLKEHDGRPSHLWPHWRPTIKPLSEPLHFTRNGNSVKIIKRDFKCKRSPSSIDFSFKLTKLYHLWQRSLPNLKSFGAYSLLEAFVWKSSRWEIY